MFVLVKFALLQIIQFNVFKDFSAYAGVDTRLLEITNYIRLLFG